MLGKNPNGINKLTSVTTKDSCNLCDPTKGPVGTNSAGAKIRPAITILHKNYYTSNLSYLKGRCKTYDTNIVLTEARFTDLIPSTKPIPITAPTRV